MKLNVTEISGCSTVSGLNSSIGMQGFSGSLTPRLGTVQPQHEFAMKFLQADNIISKDLGKKTHWDTHIGMALVSNSQMWEWSRVKVDKLLFSDEEMCTAMVFLGVSHQKSIH